MKCVDYFTPTLEWQYDTGMEPVSACNLTLHGQPGLVLGGVSEKYFEAAVNRVKFSAYESSTYLNQRGLSLDEMCHICGLKRRYFG